MKELFRKYLNNQCSPEEIRELLRYFNIPDNEALLREMILETLEEEEMEEEEDSDLWQANTKKSLVMIANRLKSKRGKEIAFFQKTWFRVAAAVIVLLGGAGLFKLVKNPNIPIRDVVNTQADQTVIAPGSTKATLVLANGSTITLDSVAVGHLAKQGSTDLIKSSNTELTYNSPAEKSAEIYFNSIITPRGGQYKITLADGTKVWLNAGSSIHFPVAFTGKNRKVRITGEAYFEVTKDPSMPFTVTIAGMADVEVLGTHFNIAAYSDETEMSTTLFEGSVKVIGLANRESRIISPGQQARINANGKLMVNKTADTSQVIAWKNGLFNFNDANLETVLQQISRWYDVDVVFEGQLRYRKFDGEIQRDLSLSQVIRLLEKNHLHFIIEGKKLTVKE